MKKIIMLCLSVSMLYSAQITYDKTQTGLIRHLDLYKNPSWVAIAVTRQKKTAYFCSPKSMLEYYFNPMKWTGLGAMTSDDVTALYVTDFNSLKKIDAKKAYYVYGSEIIGPGGDDLIPFASKQSAIVFMKKYHGSRVMKFSELKMSLVDLINGRV